MELKQYWDIIWRRKWLILATLLISLIITAAGTFATQPIYRASVKLRVATATEGSLGNLRYDLNYADRLMKTYEDIAMGAPIRHKLQQAWGEVDGSALGVEILANTELMLIHVEDTDPARAADVANMAADLLLLEIQNNGGQSESSLVQLEVELSQIEREIEETRLAYEELLETQDVNSEAALTMRQTLSAKRNIYGSFLSTYGQARLIESAQNDSVSVITSAGVPRDPVKPNIPINLALGAFLGLLGGLGLVFIFDNLDSKLYTREQVESALQLPTLGRIPAAEQVKNGSKYGAPLEEAYRRLGANVLSYIRQTDHKVFIVTSALNGEGKTTVAANLASSLAYSGLNVAIVDCDLHHPALHALFGISNERGLTSVLSKQMSLTDAMQNPPMLKVNVLASGPIAANPYDVSQPTNGVMRRVHPGQVELLSTARMIATLEKLRDRFDIILLDTAPALEVTDAAVLSPLADGVILVSDLLQAQQDILHEVHQQLRDVNANVIGCVLTRDNSSLAYYKNIRNQNNHARLGTQPNNFGPQNQAYGSFIAAPSALTQVTNRLPDLAQVTNNVQDEFKSDLTQPTKTLENGFPSDLTQATKTVQNGSLLQSEDETPPLV